MVVSERNAFSENPDKTKKKQSFFVFAKFLHISVETNFLTQNQTQKTCRAHRHTKPRSGFVYLVLKTESAQKLEKFAKEGVYSVL